MAQVIDAIYPGTVPVSKLNYQAHTEYDYIRNWKVVQQVFKKHGIDKVRHVDEDDNDAHGRTQDIDVNKLIKGKYQDNLEFLQWLKVFYDNTVDADAEPYDGAAVRKAAGCEYKPAGGKGGAAAKTPTKTSGMKSPGMRGCGFSLV